MRLRIIKLLAYTAIKWQSWDLNLKVTRLQVKNKDSVKSKEEEFGKGGL